MSSSQTAKVTKLESLSDPEKVKKFIVDVTNASRKTEVKETKTDKTVVRGNLGMLIKARVIPYTNKLTGDTVSPDGTEDVLPGENFGAKKWSDDLCTTAEETLYALFRDWLGDKLAKKIHDKFDSAFEAEGTEVLRYIYTFRGAEDAHTKNTTARANFDAHRMTRIRAGVTGAELVDWVETLEALNEELRKQEDDEDLIAYALDAVSDEALHDKLSKAHESLPTLSRADIEKVKSEWRACTERHVTRTERRRDQQAMAAQSVPSGQSAEVAALTAQMQQMQQMMSAMSAMVASQHQPQRPPTNTPRSDFVLCGVEGKPGPTGCGKHHPGGPAKCFFLHPNLVPGHMNYMLRGIHSRRAACTPPLEDLSAQYPCIARGAAAVSRAEPEEEVCETCPDSDACPDPEGDAPSMPGDVCMTESEEVETVVEDVVIKLSSTVCEVHQQALAVKSTSDVVELMVDGGASVDATGDESMFDPSTLVPAVGKFIEVANGVVLRATHVGTIRVMALDSSSTPTVLSLEGAWLVPDFALTLLSVRACKERGWRAPCYNEMMVFTDDRAFPIRDTGVSYVLDCAPASMSAAAAVVARGRNPIPNTKSGAKDAAEVVRSTFGHLGHKSLRTLLESTNGVPNIDKVLKGLSQLGVDETKMEANSSKKPAPDAHVKDMIDLGFVAGDIKDLSMTRCHIGPFKGAKYVQSWVDIKAGYIGVYFFSRKTSTAVRQSLEKFIAEVREFKPDYSVYHIRTDGAQEYASAEMDEWYGAHRIKHTYGAPYTPNQTLVEGIWHVLASIVRSDLLHAGGDQRLFPYYFLQASRIWNVLKHAGADVSPLEFLTGKRQSVAAFRPMQCRAFVKKSEREHRVTGALSPLAWAGTNLGVARNSPGYMIYVAEQNKVVISTNVDFLVTQFPGAAHGKRDEPYSYALDIDHEIPAPPPDSAGSGDDDDGDSSVGDGDIGSPNPSHTPSVPSSGNPSHTPSVPSSGNPSHTPSVPSSGFASDDEVEDVSARSTRTRTQAPDPNDLTQWGSSHPCAFAAKMHNVLNEVHAIDAGDISEAVGCDDGQVLLVETRDANGARHVGLLVDDSSPFLVQVTRIEKASPAMKLTARAALDGPRGAEHHAAADKELTGHLDKLQTFHYVRMDEMPKDKTLLDLLWVVVEKYGRKDGLDNQFLKAKWRLVANGKHMQEGKDYDPFQTSSPVMRFETFRYLGAKAAATSRPLRSSDAVMAYCNAQLPPDRHQPARMPKSHRSYDPVDGMELGVLITKALYGLVPSGNDWNREVNSFIVKPRSEGGLGMVRSCADPCYYHWAEGDKWADIGLYTDNALHLESDDGVYRDIMDRLQAKYEWEEEGELDLHLGCRVIQDLDAGTVKFMQEGYIVSMAETFPNLVGARRVQTPATSKLEAIIMEAVRTKETRPLDTELLGVYRRLLGALLFCSVVSRPDIAYAVGMLSRVMSCPTREALFAAGRVLTYLVQTKGYGLTFSRSHYFSARSGSVVARDDPTDTLRIVMSSDSDFAAGPSITGFEGRLAGAAAFWGSKRQAKTEVSSTGTEIVAGSASARMGCFMRNLMEDGGVPQTDPTLLMMDNKGAIALAHDPQAWSKTKHVVRHHHFLRECVEDGRMRVEFVRSEYNLSDIFTKPLEAKQFKLLRAALMNLPVESLESPAR